MFLYPKIARKGFNSNVSIAVRNTDPFDIPEELILAYVSSGEALVATTSRVYGATSSWRHEFSLGPALDVATEFLQKWDRDEEGNYRSASVGEPFYTWIIPLTPNSGKLVFSNGPFVTPIVLVDDHVTAVDMVHGWKNVNKSYLDQGLIVGYVRQGTAYLLTQHELEDGRRVWDQAKEVTLPVPVKSIQLFRTTDYRVGVTCVGTDNSVYVAYTARTYAGVGVTNPDSIHVSVDPAFNMSVKDIVTVRQDIPDGEYMEITGVSTLIDIGHMNGVNNAFVGSSNPDAFSIIIDTLYPVHNAINADYTVKDESGRRFRVIRSRVYQYGEGKASMILEMENLNNAHGDITITLRNNGNAGNFFKDKYATPLSTSFTPTGLVPYYMPMPELVTISNKEAIE